MMRNHVLFNASWVASSPIESLFDRLEECFVVAMITHPPYTQEQMIDKALIAIQLTGAYEIATQEWAGFAANAKTWHQLKAHSTEAYNIRLSSGLGTAGMAGYHGTANAMDDNSLGSITQSISNTQIVNNANVQVLNENISTITAETRNLSSTLAAAQQQIAALLASQRVAAPPTPAAVYILMPPPAYITVTPR